MEDLPIEIYQKIFVLFDHQQLAIAQQVCRNWRNMASENTLWCELFKKRWGESNAQFYEPSDNSKSWKDVYEVQDRCDRVGLGLKIIREGCDYYIIYQGQIQRYLGSNVLKRKKGENSFEDVQDDGDSVEDGAPNSGLLDNILFFVGDLEVAMCNAKRSRLL